MQTAKKIDAIKSADVQHLKGRLRTKAAKTVNNILTVLNVLLKNQPLAVQSFWRHFGDGEGLRRKDQWLEQLNWLAWTKLAEGERSLAVRQGFEF